MLAHPRTLRRSLHTEQEWLIVTPELQMCSRCLSDLPLLTNKGQTLEPLVVIATFILETNLPYVPSQLNESDMQFFSYKSNCRIYFEIYFKYNRYILRHTLKCALYIQYVL